MAKKKKSWKKNLARTEKWKSGRYSVTRSSKGRFVQLHKIRTYTRHAPQPRHAPKPTHAKPKQKTRFQRAVSAVGLKRIAVYGTRHGKRRRWLITGRNGKDQHDAIAQIAYHHPPRRQFTIVDAEALMENPDEYIEGYWDDIPAVVPDY